MKILKKKLFKVLPLWVLLILLVGTGAAAFLWISNEISTLVDVIERPIELTGSFETSAYKNETIDQLFFYTINNISQSSGYIYLTFITKGGPDTLSVDDINVTLSVRPAVGDTQWGALFAGYPQTPFTNKLAFLFEQDGGGAFDFSNSGLALSGMIDVFITYNVAYSGITATMQVTSTSS